ncbi:MAG TPA: phosphatase PAP2 family protein [Steroidobacteraceae bacterium]|nr:phosphatase PAP2 family protein [Steroidobacteraceae bacterium]
MHATRRTTPWLFALLVLAPLLMQQSARGQSDAQAPTQQSERAATTSHAASRTPGFLEPHERPDSLQLLPPPPRKGTAAHAADVESYRAMRSLRDTPRWRLAIADANVHFPHAASTFACALGIAVTESTTPNLYRLLQRSMVDAGQSTLRAKDEYARPRPFAVYGDRMCVPDDDRALRKSGAYPSGHAAAGWAWALILAEIAPDRAGPILRRGYEFGVSRVVCGVHWMSDVESGRTVGAAAVARLHADAEFVAQLARARDEVARVRREHGAQADAVCAAEARALAVAARR